MGPMSPKPRRSMDVDIWSLLLTDILAEIFRRLDASDVIRCACACKTWRRAIIGNASRLRPRPDRHNPNLLLGFFHEYMHKSGIDDVHLQRVPGPFESALKAAPTADDGDDEPGFCEKQCSFIPATSAGGVDLSSYNQISSSRDGFLLLSGWYVHDDLCLCNPLTGYCAFLPDVEFLADYILITSYDLDPPGDDDDLGGVQIVAMDAVTDVHGFLTVTYQLSSPTAGAGKAAAYTWGPVKRSDEFKKRLRESPLYEGTEVICRGAIYWLGELIDGNTCVLAVDVPTGRTWTIEMPEQRLNKYSNDVLATSTDGWISLVCKVPSWGGKTLHVWVLVDGDRWTLRQKIHVPNLNWLNEAFCPRSGWLLGGSCKQGQEFLVDVERGTARPISYRYAKQPESYECRHPYEMDWSTYLSRMKQF